ncbi:DNA-directed RNA polymerase III subunit RPC3 [Helicoverpa zea]|uniref:DNA-directed RNA polymerase III subunit RPC3 n=1 Tax=Helicoverpa zea TaxID=7113 RepID=UPI001F58E900|nr:DNA-directed RNA polymerase III subunit RPC3 [Helicoverpa zea]
MSHQLGRVVSVILHRYFGELVQKVGDDLFTYGSKPIGLIVKTTGFPRNQVIDCLRTLLKFDLATFEPSANEVIADYKLIPDNVLLLIRYPRYLLQVKSKFGSEAELLVEELLQKATCTATVLLFTLAMKYKDDKEKNITIISLKDMFISLVTAGYIQQAPVAELKEGSEIPTLVPVATIVPELDTRALVQAMNTGSISEINDNIYWRVNYDRFHLDFRDEIMIKAITRRIDENAGELMRFLLEQMYLRSPAWAPESSPLCAIELKERCRGVAADRPTLHQFVDQYLKVLEESGCGFVRRVGDAGAGQFAVCTRRAALQLVVCALEHLVTERLGSKAARIFRLVRSRKYIEEDDIQKNAMLVNKECKQLTYKLLEEHFISVQPMRKAASAGGLAKAIYLYHINLHDVAQSALEMCYRSLHNVIRRHSRESTAHARLRDKRRRVATIVHGMRLRGEPQQNIDDVEETLTPPELAVLQSVEKRLKQLSIAELELDKNLFIFKLYFMFPETK